MEKPKKLS